MGVTRVFGACRRHHADSRCDQDLAGLALIQPRAPRFGRSERTYGLELTYRED